MKRTTLLILLSFFSLRHLGAQCVVDISPGLTENLHSVHFVNANIGMAVGEGGHIILTTNGGMAWTTSTNALTGQNLNGIFMVSANEAWAVGDGGIIRHTTDGGNTWHQQYSPTTCHLTDVRFSGGNGLIVGECGIVLKYDPVNSTWHSVRTTSTENFHSIRFIDDDTAFIAGANGKLFKTTDGGNLWTSVPSPTTSDIIGFEIMGNNGYLSDANGNIYLSNDGGATWPTQTSAGNMAHAFAAFAPGQTLAVGPMGFVSKTNNGGVDWETLTNPAINGDLVSVSFSDQVVAYAVGANGLVVKILFLEIEAAADSLICNGSPVSLSITGPGMAANYQWAGPNYSSNEQNPTFNAAGNNSGQYIATANVTGCLTTDTINLIVASLPTASALGFDLSCDPNATNELQGGSTTQNVGYSWSGPGISPANSMLQNPTVTVQGTYTLTVTDANGCTATKLAIVTGNADFPDIGILLPMGADTTLDCSQPNILLESTFSIPDYTITWTLPNGNTDGNENITAAGPGIYTVEILNNANGCANETQVIITEDFAVPSAAAAPNGVIGCGGGTAELTGASNTGTEFVWMGPSPSQTIYNGQTVTVSQPGNYTLTVTADNGCSSTATAIVEANDDLPSLSVLPGQNYVGCVGETLNLVATTDAPNLEWNTGATTDTLTITLNSIGTNSYSVTAFGANGCQSTQIIDVTTNPEPGAMASASDIDCNGQGQLNGGSPASQVNYEWQFGGSFFSNQQNPTVSQTGTYNLTVTDTNTSCQSETSVEVNTATGIPDASANASDNTLTCLVDEITLEGFSNIPNVDVAWYNENGDLIASTYIIQVQTPGAYFFVVNNPALAGCPDTATVNIMDDLAEPDFDIIGNPIPCPGQSTTIYANPGPSGSGIEYIWNGTVSNDSLTVTSSGIYTLVGTFQSNGCTNTATFEVTTNPAPTVGLGSDVSICDLANNPVTIVPNPPNWSGYSWLPNGESTQNITVNAAGTYTVEVTDADGCTAVSTVVVENSDIVQISQSENLCTGSSIEVGGVLIDSEGTYVISLSGNGADCDTTLTLVVTETPLPVANGSAQFCEGGSVTVYGVEYASAGTYPVTLPGNGAACDTALTLVVTEIPLTMISGIEHLCTGSSITVYGTTITTGGDYTINLQGMNGACDTVIHLSVDEILEPETLDLVGETSPCAGSTVIYTIANYDSALDYSWPNYPPGTTIIDNGNTATITFGNTSGMLQLSATDAYGCFTKETILDIGIVNVPASPLQTDVPFPCISQPTNVSVQTVAGATNYIWTLPGGSMQTTTVPTSPTFSLDVPGPFQVSVFAENACGESPPTIIQSSAQPLPSAELTGDATLCPGESAALSISLSGNGPWTVGYSDGFGNTLTFNTNSSSYDLEVTPSGSTVYELTSVQSGSCMGTASGTADITVVSETAPDTLHEQICLGDQFPFNGQVFDETGVYAVPIIYSATCSVDQVLDLLVVDPDLLSIQDTLYFYFEDGENPVTLNILGNIYPDPRASFVLEILTPDVNQLEVQANNTVVYSNGEDVSFDYAVSLEVCPDVALPGHAIVDFRSNCFSAKNEYMPKAFIAEGESSIGDDTNEKFDPFEAVSICLDGKPFSEKIQAIELVVVNGWGEVVFRSNNNNFVWTQAEAGNFPEATYYYSFKFSYQGRIEIIKGPISIVKKKK